MIIVTTLLLLLFLFFNWFFYSAKSFDCNLIVRKSARIFACTFVHAAFQTIIIKFYWHMKAHTHTHTAKSLALSWFVHPSCSAQTWTRGTIIMNLDLLLLHYYYFYCYVILNCERNEFTVCKVTSGQWMFWGYFFV